MCKSKRDAVSGFGARECNPPYGDLQGVSGRYRSGLLDFPSRCPDVRRRHRRPRLAVRRWATPWGPRVSGGRVVPGGCGVEIRPVEVRLGRWRHEAPSSATFVSPFNGLEGCGGANSRGVRRGPVSSTGPGTYPPSRAIRSTRCSIAPGGTRPTKGLLRSPVERRVGPRGCYKCWNWARRQRPATEQVVP